jgi:dihydrofolate reductase/thymidylate synthase
MLKFNLIVAVNKNNVIGSNNNIPWNNPFDLKLFQKITSDTKSLNKKNVIVMGFNTFNSLGKELPNRINLVMSSKSNFIHSLDELLLKCSELNNLNLVAEFFIIGGAHIYELALNNLFINKIYYSEINDDSKGDTFFPLSLDEIKLKYHLKYREDNNNFIFNIFKRKFKPFEYQYQKILKNILNNGIIKNTRNSNTKSINDCNLKLDLSDGFPIMTLKKSFWRGIVEELLWMLRGETNTKILAEKDIHIWDKNSTREYLDNNGLSDYDEGEIGPGYGYQFRHADNHDQLMECIKLIKEDKNSRRIIINLWNVKDLNKMALPPCHLLYQFTVTNDKLNCHFYQRSWDMLLGWNTTTAALLTHILAHQTNLEVGTLTHTICDVHIYSDHLKNVSSMLERIPYKLPKLMINKNSECKIEEYEFNDFILNDYKFHPAIKFNMFA